MPAGLAIAAILTAAALAYCGFVLWRLGVHRRLPLIVSPISLETIPDRAARRYGERTLFTCDPPVRWAVPALADRFPDGARWSAVRIRDTAACLAGALQDRLKIARGDRIAICKSNHFDVLVLIAGAVRAGAVACPINGRFGARDIGPYLTNLGARTLISDSATLARLVAEGAALGPVETIVLAEPAAVSAGAVPPLKAGPAVLSIESLLEGARPLERPAPRGREDPAYLTHSSGTTGFPKAVILRNGAQSHAVRGWLAYVHVSAADRGYLAVPTNHQAVILTFNAMLLMGARGHWIESYGLRDFDAERVIGELAEKRSTVFFGFPLCYTQMKEVPLDRHDLSAMRVWGSTADAAHEAIQRRFVRVGGAFRSLGLPIDGSVYLDAQGSSEVGTPSVLRYITPFTKKFARRVGKPGSAPFGPAVRIAADGKPVRRGEVARLEVKGRTVFNAYWNDHALTYLAFSDGWFFTGDVARMQDGHIVQLDREVDVIHTASGPVYSLPIEERLHFHPAVFDLCVYGARQGDGTQAPAAAVALREGADIGPDKLREELNAMLEPNERLDRVEILDWSDFPIGITGKTLKRAFRDRSAEPGAR